MKNRVLELQQRSLDGGQQESPSTYAPEMFLHQSQPKMHQPVAPKYTSEPKSRSPQTRIHTSEPKTITTHHP
jgi:hypothetical protein